MLPILDHIGTVHALFDPAQGEIVARYAYTPFGELIGESGEAKDACPFRYSGKYWDRETGLLYYGYRYYDPTTTKWLNYDPLGEEGGVNLTAFCRNDPVNGFDPLGLAVYGFGGTGNENDDDLSDGFSIVEQLIRASVQSANGEAYHMLGVFSGYTPTGKKNGFFPSLTMPGQGARGWTLGKRVDLMIQAMEREFANTGDKEVNVPGFSRGSTAAVEFLNRVAENVKDREKAALYKGMKINFVGLWDTVKTTTKDYRTDLPAGLIFEHRPIVLCHLV